MRGTRAATTAVIGTVLTGLLLTGCTAIGGDGELPKPHRTSAAMPSTPAHDAGADASADAALANQDVPADTPPKRLLAVGAVGAETEVVSKSGDTRLHVRIVQGADGFFVAELSGYRTTNPQPMSLQFRHRIAHFRDGGDASVRSLVQWDTASGPPSSITLADVGPRPDYLRSAVLVPVAGDDDGADRPWVGSVLAVGELDWTTPNPYPDLRVSVGTARPGAYGYVQDASGRPTSYTVAHGDDLTTVAKRFDITPDEFRWMNPYLTTHDDGWLFEGDVLNIDPASR